MLVGGGVAGSSPLALRFLVEVVSGDGDDMVKSDVGYLLRGRCDSRVSCRE